VHGAEPPVLVVVGGAFFLPLVVVALAVVGAIGEVTGGIDAWPAVVLWAAAPLLSPLESEPQPPRTASSAAAPSIKRRDRPTPIGPGM
jgi:hypothetical protein